MAGDGDAKSAKCPVCGSMAVHRCSSCREVSYCSKEHQKMDWKNHKVACKAYEVKTSESLGRYLVATRDLNPGDIIITETPLVFAPKSMFDPESFAPCVGCYKPVNLDVGERCPSCGWPVCSGMCKGLKNLNQHGLECIALTLRPHCAVNNLGEYYRHDALMALRILLAQNKFQKKYKKILELQSHLEERKGTEIYKEVDDFIVKYLQDNFLHPLRAVETELKTGLVTEMSEKLIHTICGIVDVNCLDVNLNNGCELTALYHTACMMEHNCTPNTKHTFNVNINDTDENSQFRITVKAAVPIKKGENITTMYSHALWGTMARREHLRETKYFNCSCNRCKDPTELGTCLSAMRCIGSGDDKSSSCGGVQLPDNPLDVESDWSCDKCPVKIKSSQVSYLTSKMGEEVENVQAMQPTIDQLEVLLDKLSTFLHPNHYHMYSIKHSLVQLYGNQIGQMHKEMKDKDLEKKAVMCQDLLDVTKKIDPGNCRLCLYSGVLYHELHQTNFEQLKRKIDSKTIKRGDVSNEVGEVRLLLRYARRALEDESEGSPGQKLRDVIVESERRFLKWTSDHNYS